MSYPARTKEEQIGLFWSRVEKQEGVRVFFTALPVEGRIAEPGMSGDPVHR